MLLCCRHLRTVQCNATHTVPDEKKDKLGASAEDQLFQTVGINFTETPASPTLKEKSRPFRRQEFQNFIEVTISPVVNKSHYCAWCC